LGLFSYVVAQYTASFNAEFPLVGVYVSAVNLAGITYDQDSGSGQFGIAQSCLVLVHSAQGLPSVPARRVSSFAAELYHHAQGCRESYSDALWVIVSLLATALATSSGLAAEADLEMKLSEYLATAEWTNLVSAQSHQPDSIDECQAMAELLRRSSHGT
jgi:hypothetical protein